MAGRGPAPSPERRRRNKQATPERVLADAGVLHGPPLPAGVLPDGEEWHPQTRALWDALRRSPLLADEPELGWAFLVDMALMHHTMWQKGRWEFASEVRLRVAKVRGHSRGSAPVEGEDRSPCTAAGGDAAAADGHRGSAAVSANRRGGLTDAVARPG